MSHVSMSDVYYPSNDVKYFTSGQLVSIHDLIEDKYYNLDEISSSIWVYFNGIRTVYDIVSLLQNEYEVDRKELNNDVLHFINQLLKTNLITNVGSLNYE